MHGVGLHHWFAFARDSPKPFRRVLRALVESLSSGFFTSVIHQESSLSGLGPFDGLVHGRTPWACYECGEAFSTRARLNLHAHDLHGYRNPLSLRVVGTVCPGCMTEHHSRTRLIENHLRKVERCARLVSQFPVLTQDVLAIELQAEAAHRRRCYASCKSASFAQSRCFRVPGPLMEFRAGGFVVPAAPA